MASPSSSALSYVSTLARPDSSEIDELNFPCAEDASKDSTSRTVVFPVPFAPIITDSGRNASSTSYRRRKPWMKSWPKRTEEWSILFSGPKSEGPFTQCTLWKRWRPSQRVRNRFGGTTNARAHPSGQTLGQTANFRQTAPEIHVSPGLAAHFCPAPPKRLSAPSQPGIAAGGAGGAWPRQRKQTDDKRRLSVPLTD